MYQTFTTYYEYSIILLKVQNARFKHFSSLYFNGKKNIFFVFILFSTIQYSLYVYTISVRSCISRVSERLFRTVSRCVANPHSKFTNLIYQTIYKYFFSVLRRIANSVFGFKRISKSDPLRSGEVKS